MATEKQINSRIIHKHDVESNWNRAATFVPKQGEIIIYDIDANNTVERFKVGDGKTTVIDLPFYLEHEVDMILSQINYLANNTLDAVYENGKLVITKGITIPNS